MSHELDPKDPPELDPEGLPAGEDPEEFSGEDGEGNGSDMPDLSDMPEE